MLRLDVDFDGVVIVAYYFADVAVAYVLLKFVVAQVLGWGCALVGEVQSQQSHGNKHVQPVQVELGYIHFWFFISIIVIVHTFVCLLIEVGDLG